jgi:hypothetical protein
VLEGKVEQLGSDFLGWRGTQVRAVHEAVELLVAGCAAAGSPISL